MDVLAILRVADAIGLDLDKVSIELRASTTCQSNRLYDLKDGQRHLIAKVFVKPDELATAPVCEFSGLQLVSKLDVAPQPVFFDASIAPIVVYQFMEGQSWGRRLPTPDELRQLADVRIEIGKISAEKLWLSRGQRPLQTYITNITSGFQIYTDWVTRQALPEMAPLPHLEEILERVSYAVDLLSQDKPTAYSAFYHQLRATNFNKQNGPSQISGTGHFVI